MTTKASAVPSTAAKASPQEDFRKLFDNPEGMVAANEGLDGLLRQVTVGRKQIDGAIDHLAQAFRNEPLAPEAFNDLRDRALVLAQDIRHAVANLHEGVRRREQRLD